MLFRQRPIHDQKQLGEKLLEQRKRLNLQLEKISAKINIPLKYLLALENGDYKNLPANVYSKNFLKRYLEELKLPAEPLTRQFLEERSNYEALHERNKKEPFVAKVSEKNLINTPRIIRITFVLIIVGLLIGYLGLEIKDIISPPRLAIFEPPENLTLNTTLITVRGQTEPEAKITINEQEVLADPTGNFFKELQLQTGINTIKITAKKKHSRENFIYRNIFVEEIPK
ncbi:MAG: helix-turn-helix domain-containing protein [Patescibacteria group bacterium]|nr:helix-turn-helix domain-containing protein [Patescibacteria group bacterium]MDD5490906.1 helix-turn-helix domain-containing protein [Patescibacteria group bacterium]